MKNLQSTKYIRCISDAITFQTLFVCTKQVGWGTKCRMARRTYKEKTTKEEKGRQQGMTKLENERVNKQDYSAAPNAEVS